MRTIYMMLVMLLVAMVPAYGQKQEKKSKAEMRREIRDFKIKYLAQEMELSDEQKEKFVPLYDKMCTERWQLFKPARTLERDLKKNEKATEADYKAAADAMTEARDRDAKLMKEYDARFSKFLTAKQIYKMREAEQEFDKRMRKMHKERKMMKQAKTQKQAPGKVRK